MRLATVGALVMLMTVNTITAQTHYYSHHRVASSCRPELDSICTHVKHRQWKRVQCLNQHFKQLSLTCLTSLYALPILECSTDALDLCPMTQGFRSVECLTSQIDMIESERCKKTIIHSGYNQCKNDIQVVCPDAHRGRSLVRCLHENLEQVSTYCYDALIHNGQKQFPYSTIREFYGMYRDPSNVVRHGFQLVKAMYHQATMIHFSLPSMMIFSYYLFFFMSCYVLISSCCGISGDELEDSEYELEDSEYGPEIFEDELENLEDEENMFVYGNSSITDTNDAYKYVLI